MEVEEGGGVDGAPAQEVEMALLPFSPDGVEAPQQQQYDELGASGGLGAMGNRWPQEETLELLKIRSEMDAAFRSATLKGPLWEQISSKLAKKGYCRSAKKCEEKFESVHKCYKLTKESHAGRNDGKFSTQLEAVHGTPDDGAAGGPASSVVPLPPATSSAIGVSGAAGPSSAVRVAAGAGMPMAWGNNSLSTSSNTDGDEDSDKDDDGAAKLMEEEFYKLRAVHDAVVLQNCHLETELLRMKRRLAEVEEEKRKLIAAAAAGSSSPNSSSFSTVTHHPAAMVFGIEVEDFSFSHANSRYSAAGGSRQSTRSSSSTGTAVHPGSSANKPQQDIMKLKETMMEQRQPIESAPDERPRSTFCKDIKAWFCMQYERGLRHTCIRQVGPQVLGRNDIRDTVTQKILLDTNGGSNCTVICINAGSGHGKTSLLRVLYNDQQLMDAFEKRIWIQMSDKVDILMLFRKIIEVAMNDYCSITNLGCLQEMVKEEIADKKLLLFMDDADIEDQQFWNAVLEVLNAGTKRSALVMATSSATAAALGGLAAHSYILNPLSEQNNMMLLQQYAGTDIQINPDLLMVAQGFISMFGYNPLNLKAMGGLLCHADSISLEMDKFEGSVIPLQLCHDVLPTHLKKCLAFCSLFPVGYIFDKQHMVLQWISHGCVKPAEGCDVEDVGVEYFNELLCRSFFQCSPAHNETDDKFVMHELMYKVVESVSRDKYFASEDATSSIPENMLHLSLVSPQFRTVELMSQTEELKDLQTFLVVQPEWQPYKITFPTLKLVGLDDFFLKFTSIKTLDLSHTDTEELPQSIAGLRNLQYLSVNNTSIKALPSELCSLSNLQTLEAKDCRFLTELPGDSKKLLKLRHLDVTKELDYVHLPHGIGHLTELRTLPVFHASGDLSELRNLNNLRGCLRLSGLENVKTGSKAEEANLKDKQHLLDLTLQWHDSGIHIDVDNEEDTENVAEQVLESLQPHTNLQELAIRGYEGNSFPDWMQGSSSLPNLVSLTLDGFCNCTEFPAISQLPLLKFLSVRKMYCVQRLITNNVHGSTTKFPSLELLNLWEMYGLEELFESSDGDCPRLRKVCVSRCPDLKRLPCTPSVKELVLHYGHELPDIPELASLVSLKIEGFHGVKSFSLPALPVLKKVEIRSCKELVSVDGLSAPTTVQRLIVAGCPKLVLPTTDSNLTT